MAGGVGRANENLGVLHVRLEGFVDGVDERTGVAVGGGDEVCRGRQDVVVIGEVDMDGRADLLEVADGLRLFGGVFGLCEDREEDGGEDRDDGDHDKQLDQRKCFFHHGFETPLFYFGEAIELPVFLGGYFS